eukprot:4755398-Pyramimonas_sp.AAC.1
MPRTAAKQERETELTGCQDRTQHPRGTSSRGPAGWRAMGPPWGDWAPAAGPQPEGHPRAMAGVGRGGGGSGLVRRTSTD